MECMNVSIHFLFHWLVMLYHLAFSQVTLQFYWKCDVEKCLSSHFVS